MADWYVSSAAYAATPAWAATTAYTVGQFVRPTAPIHTNSYMYRCTTAGTSGASEPSWPTGNNSTVTNGTAVFTNISGQSAYGWSGAFGALFTLQGVNTRTANGDRIFLSSDHAETFSSFTSMTFGQSGGYGLVQLISVNRAGSVPPVDADVRSGASITNTNNTFTLDAFCELYYSGITFNTGTAALRFCGASYAGKNIYFKNCKFVTGGLAWLSGMRVTLDNTPIQFTAVGAVISGGSNERCDLTWINTPNAIQGSIPTNLFTHSYSDTATFVTMRGVDLSALTTTLLRGSQNWVAKILLDSCRIAPGLTRYAGDTTYCFNGEVELVNCYDGTNVINERWNDVGNVSTDRATYMNSGAQDNIGNYSLKLAETLTVSDFLVSLVECFTLDVESGAIGAPKTASVEIASASSLTNRDVQLLLEHMGGGYTTWSPTDLVTLVLSNGNLTATAIGAGGGGVRNPFVLAAGGKYYWECTVNIGSANSSIGIALSTAAFGTGFAFQGGTAGIVASGGSFYVNAAFQSGCSLGAPAANEVIGIAVDRAANLLWMRKAPSGNWNNSGTANPATGVGGRDISSIATGSLMPAFFAFANTENCTANFGVGAFVGLVPAGFSAPRTSNDPLASFVSSLSSPLVTAAALPASGATWAGSPASKQLLQVTFTPQRAGRVRGLVRLGKASTTVWVNPQITIV